MTSPAPKRCRYDLTLDQKREICVYYEEQISKNYKLTHADVAQHFSNEWKCKIARNTISTTLKKKEIYFDNNNLRQPRVKRLREAEHPELEQCLYLWFSDKRGNNIPINESMLIEQAKRFGEYLGIEHNFKYSNGWLENFKFRFNVKHYCTSGESKSVDPITVEKGVIDLKALICRYDLENIYNFDETALFYRLPPNKTLASCSTSGTKESKERISIGLCVNATGSDKCKPVVIAKFKRPRCFGKLFDPNDLIHYYHNEKAWITMIIFKQFVFRNEHDLTILI
jgi:hypothetical protein